MTKTTFTTTFRDQTATRKSDTMDYNFAVWAWSTEAQAVASREASIARAHEDAAYFAAKHDGVIDQVALDKHLAHIEKAFAEAQVPVVVRWSSREDLALSAASSWENRTNHPTAVVPVTRQAKSTRASRANALVASVTDAVLTQQDVAKADETPQVINRALAFLAEGKPVRKANGTLDHSECAHPATTWGRRQCQRTAQV